MHAPRPLALILTALVLLPGCASTTVATVEPACRSIRTVTVSKDDALTDGTARQIEGNNAARAALCPRRPA